ncbi:MAG: hypothetical protein WC897_03685 [Candidatus Gracilibacteria bacterium]
MRSMDGKIVGNMSDLELLKMCEEFGSLAIKWRQKFIGLLPEVNRRKLYEKKGCQSIYEFAAKLAGVSVEQVNQVIRLERKFEDKPALHTALTDGEVSVSKLERVSSLATPENDADLLEMAKNFPRKALEVSVRDIKNFQNKNGLPQPLFDPKVLPGQNFSTLKHALSNEVIEELNRLDEQGQDINEILMELLEYRKQKIEQEKQKISAEVKQTDSRYVNVKTKHVLEEEYGKKCSAPGCNKLAMAIHHTLPFALAHRHDPAFMAPLCHEHHQIAHLKDLSYQKHLWHK